MKRLVTDTMITMERNLVRLPRQPDLLTAYTIQPIMFVLLFVYVFGGAINVERFGFDDYKDFMIPGIIVQSIAFGGFVTAIGLVEDLNKGLIDRFRSLPMARAALLAGRTIADVFTNIVSLVVLVGTGLVIGFSFHTGIGDVLLGVALLLLVGYAFSWVFAFLGMLVSTPESANALGFMLIFPLTFVSSAFVPTETMPEALRWFADVNPFTIWVDEMRDLWSGTADGTLWQAVAWPVGITAVFAPLAVWRYRKSAERG